MTVHLPRGWRKALRSAALAPLLVSAPAVSDPPVESRIVAEREEGREGASVLSWEARGDAGDEGWAALYSIWTRAGAGAPAEETDEREAGRLAALYGETFTASLLEEGWRYAAGLPAGSAREYIFILPAADGPTPSYRIFAHEARDTSSADPPPEPPDTTGSPAPADTLAPPEPPDSTGSPAPADTLAPPEPPDTTGSPAPPDSAAPPFPEPSGGPPPSFPALLPPAPNPFNPEVIVPYLLPEASFVRLAVHDARGRFVVLLEEGTRGAGRGEVLWDGRDGEGRPAPSGVYLIRMEADGFRAAVRAVLIR